MSRTIYRTFPLCSHHGFTVLSFIYLMKCKLFITCILHIPSLKNNSVSLYFLRRQFNVFRNLSGLQRLTYSRICFHSCNQHNFHIPGSVGNCRIYYPTPPLLPSFSFPPAVYLPKFIPNNHSLHLVERLSPGSSASESPPSPPPYNPPEGRGRV